MTGSSLFDSPDGKGPQLAPLGWSRYVVHLAFAIVGGLILTVLLGFVFTIAAGERFANLVFNGPLFAMPLLIGFWLGYLFNRVYEEVIACYIWIVPSVALMLSIAVGPPLRDLFTVNCRSTECLYELTVTLPCYLCAAYSLGAWLALRRRGGKC